jgi:hypothetical protein
MTTTPAEKPTHLRRLADGSEWYGCLTLENLDLVAARIRSLLEGKSYTFVTCNEGLRDYFPEVRTSLRLREGVSTWVDEKAGRFGGFNVADSYGVWGMHTDVPDISTAHSLSYDEQRKRGGYLHIKHERIEMEHFAPADARLYWVAAIEYPQD